MYCVTKLMKESFTLNWYLENLDAFEIESGTRLQSCKFPRVGEHKNCFQLYLYPNGYNVSYEGYISLYLHSDKEIKVSYSMSLFCNEIEVKKCSSIDRFSNRDGKSGFEKFLELNSILIGKNDQKIMVRCTVNTVSSKAREILNPLLFPKISPDGREHLTKLNYETCREHFTDVELVASGTVFPAHKLILTLHSKVFAAMFQHDMKEKQTCKVEIPDFKSETVQFALQHAYSGKFLNMSLESALELLHFSDKYDLIRLRKECANHLSNYISVGNVHDVLLAADLSNTSELKAVCLEFIRLYLTDALKGDEWKSKFKSRPHLLEEIIETIVRDQIDHFKITNK